ncbi:MAG: hypothetical protein FWG75_09460 [Cystobacterineae bacterium]|nr:hypothetical protein [Cystobacterineae bacterium]
MRCCLLYLGLLLGLLACGIKGPPRPPPKRPASPGMDNPLEEKKEWKGPMEEKLNFEEELQ